MLLRVSSSHVIRYALIYLGANEILIYTQHNCPKIFFFHVNHVILTNPFSTPPIILIVLFIKLTQIHLTHYNMFLLQNDIHIYSNHQAYSCLFLLFPLLNKNHKRQILPTTNIIHPITNLF